jgi:methylated-DNA-[protein]-cysteine S-methyltransferase
MTSENGQTARGRFATMFRTSLSSEFCMTPVSPTLKLSMDRFDSPIGTILLVHDADGSLRVLDFEDHEPRMRRLLRLHYGQEGRDFLLLQQAAPHATVDAIQRYFQGDLQAIDTIQTATAGTRFQLNVWGALRQIHAGTTVTYGALAQGLGCPKAVRAVGLANGANPIGIVVPCHRVIGADCSLTGYGGGLPRKRWLLTHEGIQFRSERHVA